MNPFPHESNLSYSLCGGLAKRIRNISAHYCSSAYHELVEWCFRAFAVILLLSEFLLILFFSPNCNAGEGKIIMNKDNYNKLSRSERNVILHKSTEPPFSGKYCKFSSKGTYLCRQCNAPLYNSTDKFDSSCGWPSFDDEIKGAVKRIIDSDGRRTEILCANCGGHLGHLFAGEGFSKKNIRHCVNSISMSFVPFKEKLKEKRILLEVPKKVEKEKKGLKKAYFAGGCFWGIEYYMDKKNGVESAVSGYMGGSGKNPTYEEVCAKNTGHLEVVEVTYDPELISFESLAKYFFEIHDPTQSDGQGPDKGPQYLSAVFYNDESERNSTKKLIGILKSKKFQVVTRVIPATTFWKAEEYHQNYYRRTQKLPYCHTYRKKF